MIRMSEFIFKTRRTNLCLPDWVAIPRIKNVNRSILATASIYAELFACTRFVFSLSRERLDPLFPSEGRIMTGTTENWRQGWERKGKRRRRNPNGVGNQQGPFHFGCGLSCSQWDLDIVKLEDPSPIGYGKYRAFVSHERKKRKLEPGAFCHASLGNVKLESPAAKT